MTENKIKAIKPGRFGEDLAEAWLEKQNIKVLAKRFYRRGLGEIDLIAREKNVILIIEVKDWNRNSLAALEQSIDQQKKRRIMETAEAFLAENRQYMGFSLRFDVLFRYQKGQWKYIKNAFEFDG